MLVTSFYLAADSEVLLLQAIDNLKCKEVMQLLSKTTLTKDQKNKLHKQAREQVIKRSACTKSVLNSKRDLASVAIGVGLIALGSKISHMVIQSDSQDKPIKERLKSFKNILQKFSSYLVVIDDQGGFKYLKDRDAGDRFAKNIIHGVNAFLITVGLVHTYKGLTRSHAHAKLAEAEAIAGTLRQMCF